MSYDLTVVLVAVLCAVGSSLLGPFLILRRSAMMADAISHAILPGVVVGYWVAKGNNFGWAIIGAISAALITVSLVHLLETSGRLYVGDAMGVVFPAMFALGTIMITRFFRNVHLDTDAVLLGAIEFSPFERLSWHGRDIGAQAVYVMAGLIIVNLIFVTTFYKELKVTTFDPGVSEMMGFRPALVNWMLMFMLALTAVVAFTAVGAILTVTLLIVPAGTAYLLTNRLRELIIGAAGIAMLAAVSRFRLATALDGSVAGSISTMLGVLFLVAFVFSPLEGQVMRVVRHQRTKRSFQSSLLLAHLLTHDHCGSDTRENRYDHIAAALRWSPTELQAVIARAQRQGMVIGQADSVVLTPAGREQARAISAPPA